jgi:hypothetical protein
MCWAHYQRWIRYGHPQAKPKQRDPLVSIYERILRRPVGCWLYDSSDMTRPPRCNYRGRRVMVRRVVWETEVAPLPRGARLAPLCGTINCVRPEHYQVVVGFQKAA